VINQRSEFRELFAQRHTSKTDRGHPWTSRSGVDFGLSARIDRRPATNGAAGAAMTQLTLQDLGHDVQDFLKFKRAMGYSYDRQEFMLDSLERFAIHLPQSCHWIYAVD
jgi:hypothetical protein